MLLTGRVSSARYLGTRVPTTMAFTISKGLYISGFLDSALDGYCTITRVPLRVRDLLFVVVRDYRVQVQGFVNYHGLRQECVGRYHSGYFQIAIY